MRRIVDWYNHHVHLFMPVFYIVGAPALIIFAIKFLAPDIIESSSIRSLVDSVESISIGVAITLLILLMTTQALSHAYFLIYERRSISFLFLFSAAIPILASQVVGLGVIGDQFSWFNNLVSEQGERNQIIFTIVLDTILKGGLLDVIESYDIQVSRFVPSSGVLVFDTLELVYRTLWSLWIATFLFVLAKRLFRRQGPKQYDDSESNGS